MQMMRERMPLMREQLEPLLRERLNNLRTRIQLRTMPRIREAGDSFMLDDMEDFDEPFILGFDEPFEFEDEIEPVSREVIRELAATTVRDAQVALKHLAADGIA